MHEYYTRYLCDRLTSLVDIPHFVCHRDLALIRQIELVTASSAGIWPYCVSVCEDGVTLEEFSGEFGSWRSGSGRRKLEAIVLSRGELDTWEWTIVDAALESKQLRRLLPKKCYHNDVDSRIDYIAMGIHDIGWAVDECDPTEEGNVVCVFSNVSEAEKMVDWFKAESRKFGYLTQQGSDFTFTGEL